MAAPNSVPAFVCDLCPESETFRRDVDLKVHIDSVHLGQASFACDHCQSRFSQRRRLTMHLNSEHLQLRPCSHIKIRARVRTTGALLTVHSSVKPFACDQCESRFKLKCYLKSHIRTVHSNERPFECDICAATFKLQRGLKVHNESVQSAEKQCLLVSSAIRVEIKEEIPPEPDSVKDEIGRPFKCEICPKAFKHKCHLKYHRDSVHSTARRFACEQCEYTAVRRWQVLRHIGTVHSNGEHHRINCILAIVLWHPQILQSAMNY